MKKYVFIKYAKWENMKKRVLHYILGVFAIYRFCTLYFYLFFRFLGASVFILFHIFTICTDSALSRTSPNINVDAEN